MHYENFEVVQQVLWLEEKHEENYSRCKCPDCKQRRYCRMVAHHDTWQQQRPEQEKKKEQKQRKRRFALLHAMQQSWQERERWYLQQPDQRCSMCGQTKPTYAFGATCDASGFVPHSRCQICHDALHERKILPCCLCQKKTPRSGFLSHYNGYDLSGNGAWISLCCKVCETDFRALSDDQQRTYIRSCCQRAFPTVQVVYAEIDPETDEVRYIGRTSKPERRHGEHLRNISPQPAVWGSERKVWYTRRNWMQSLSDKGLTPSMRLLLTIEPAPLVVEWEQRYIWYGIQQGWQLLNIETVDDALVTRVRSSSFDFLTTPFAVLIQQHFFTACGLAAFLHTYCDSPD